MPASSRPCQHRALECDLGATLTKSRWLYERPLGAYHLVYAPDWPGMPVLVPPDTKQLLDRFASGAKVGEVLASIPDPSGEASANRFQLLNALFDRGFLRDTPDTDVIVPKGYRPSRKSLNIWLHISNNCNLACSYCFVEHSKMKMSRATADRTISQIISTVEKHGVDDILVKFAGGEPTLSVTQMEYFHESLVRKLQGTKVHVHWTVLTNGTNLSDRFLAFIERANATVSISIDGYGDYHDIYRVFRTSPRTKTGGAQKGSWDTINRNIEELRLRGIVPYINAMVGPRTSPGLPELAKWIFGNGMIGTLHVVRNVDDSWQPGASRRTQYASYCDQLARDFERMFLELEDDKYRINLPRWMEVAELSFDSPAPDVCCGIGADHIVIKHDGSLASCPMTIHERTVVPEGDLFEAASATFTASPTDRDPDDMCMRCQWEKVCASACPVANERIRGTAFTQSPLCKFWKYVIPRYLDFYGRKLLQAQRHGPSGTVPGHARRVMTDQAP